MFLTINDDGTRSYECAEYTYTTIDGMEGPCIYRVGNIDRVLHYSPKEGQYYDQSVDMFVEIEWF